MGVSAGDGRVREWELAFLTHIYIYTLEDVRIQYYLPTQVQMRFLIHVKKGVGQKSISPHSTFITPGITLYFRTHTHPPLTPCLTKNHPAPARATSADQ